MGIYKRVGLRSAGMQLINVINWIRLYGLKDGMKMFFDLAFTKKGEFIVKNQRLGYPFFMRDNISDLEMFRQTFLEEQYRPVLRKILSPKYIVDAGANVGASARYFHNAYPDAKIICVEPDPSNCFYIEKNTSTISNIKVLRAALWHKGGYLSISNPEDSPSSYMVSEGLRNCTIPSLTISDIINKFNIPYIDVLKLDIEGAEKEIFEYNPHEWLPKVKSIIIELHDNYKKGAGKAFINALYSYDFEVYSYNENIFVIFK